MNYNPYDLVKLVINGKPIDGRPFQFNSNVANQKTLKNAFGEFVKPTKVMTVCPDCGQGFQLDLDLPDPPFEPFESSCPICKPPPPPLVDPFVNPLKTGRLSPSDLDPLLHNIEKPLAINKSAAENFAVVPEAVVVPPLVLTPVKPQTPRDKPKTKKKAAKEPEGRIVPLEKAENDLGEEADDDTLDGIYE